MAIIALDKLRIPVAQENAAGSAQRKSSRRFDEDIELA